MLHRHSTEPTDRSMPPVMITIVMPSAMIATKAKLRVTLKRLFEVAKELVANDRKMQARHDRDRAPRKPGCAGQPAEPAVLLARLIVVVELIVHRCRLSCPDSSTCLHCTCSIAPVIRPGDLLGRTGGDRPCRPPCGRAAAR